MCKLLIILSVPFYLHSICGIFVVSSFYVSSFYQRLLVIFDLLNLSTRISIKILKKGVGVNLIAC